MVLITTGIPKKNSEFFDIHRNNPGVHTSQISKLMGYDWRTMNASEQVPYK